MENETSIKMKVGMYGGKFCPMHKGHLSVIQTALDMVDVLHVFLFINGDDEKHIEKAWYTDPQFRFLQVKRAIRDACLTQRDDRIVTVQIIDAKDHMSVDRYGELHEDWEDEADAIKTCIDHPIDYIFSSEPSYDEFFKEIYPEAQHVIVDAEREMYNISSTELRSMLRKNKTDEIMKWLI